MSLNKLLRKGAKHGAWIALSLWTGFTFVGYFTPIRDLVAEVRGFSVGPWEGFWILFYGFATYGNAGWMREQVCKYMCPYARFQSAMFDKDTLIITYDAERGEPRGKKAAPGIGDCVDCGICVQVCPTGIDIRNGLQYECIGCAACIDGCDQVMDKLGRPRGLIRYTTTHALEGHLSRKDILRRVLRPRVLAYAGILVAITLALLVSLYVKIPLKVDVLRDRAALSREVEGGMVENVYRLQVMNTTERPRAFEITATAPGDAAGGVADIEVWGDAMVIVPGADNRVALVKVRGRAQPGSHPIEFRVRAVGLEGVEVREKSVFLVR